MPKLHVYVDELYPYYGWATDEKMPGEKTFEVTEEEYAEIRRVTEEFFRIQNKLKVMKERSK